MHVEQTEQQSLTVSRDALLKLVGTLAGRSTGREDDEHPLPPGPWDPHIRIALEQTFELAPRPEPLRTWALGNSVPWRFALASLLARHPELHDAIGPGPRFGEEVELNPQPLPPRLAFVRELAQTVIVRAGLLHELAQAASGQSETRGIIIVGGYLNRFCDEMCPPTYRLKWPFPGPRPKWFAGEFDGLDLLWMATQFEQGSDEAYHPELRTALAAASEKFAAAGLAKLE